MPTIGTRFGTRGLSIGPHRGRSTTTAEFPAPTRFALLRRGDTLTDTDRALVSGGREPPPPALLA